MSAELRKAAWIALLGCYVLGFAFLVCWSSQQPRNKHVGRPSHGEIKHQPQPHQNPQWGHSDPGVTLFTFFLVVVGAVQAGLFFVQLRYMNKGMKDATIAARAASRSAVATVAQTKIARDTLAKVQRPYIFVYGVSRLMTRPDVRALTPFVEFMVANYGQTPAIIENVGIEFSEGEFPHAPLRVDEDHELLTKPIMPPNEKREGLIERLPQTFIDEDLGIVVDLERQISYPLPKISPNAELFFRVIVYYSGAFSDGHKTSACWRWHPVDHLFTQYGGRDYNYLE
jgi:hypothetical protein